MVAEVKTVLQEMTRRLVAEFQPCQIDLRVIVPDSDKSRRDREVRARHCRRDLPIAKDVLVQTQAELERTSRVYTSLQCGILERGVKLHGELSAAF